MHRKKPAFKAKPKIKALTPEQKDHARALRQQGWSVNDISVYLKTNHGRVSEAING
jgi:hypothetical protein